MQNLDQVVSNLRAGMDYRLEDGKLEKAKSGIAEHLAQMNVAEDIMTRYLNALRKLQLSDGELESHLAKTRG
jgi:hypothetical protein